MMLASRQMLTEERAGAGASGRPRSLSSQSESALRRAVDAVLVAGQNVLVVGHDEHLDRWGRQFAAAMRARSGVQLEIYIPASAESLVRRFNQALGTLSLEAARGQISSGLSSKVLLVPDMRSLDTPEGILLCRLVSDFPGANTRLVLLADRDGLVRAGRVADGLARRLVRIDLDGREHLSDAARPGFPTVSEPVPGPALKVGELPSAKPAEPDDSANFVQGERRSAQLKPTRSVVSQPVLFEASLDSSAPGGQPVEPPSPWRKKLAWFAAALALVLVSVLVVVLLHRDRVAPRSDPAGASSARAVRSVSGLVPSKGTHSADAAAGAVR